MPLSSQPTRKLRLVFIMYWFLLGYILAALIWWFIELNMQNRQMTQHDSSLLKKDHPAYYEDQQKLLDKEKRKKAQYIGEGAVFFLVIMAGAVFLYRAVRTQLKLAQQQQHFMMAITHELKTPIAVTKLNLETLQKRKLDEQQSLKLIQNSIQETNRLNALCNNILLLAQLEDRRYIVTPEDINLSELVEGSLQDFMTRYPNRTYHARIEEGIMIHGDKLLLQLAVNNLIDNATKYSGSNGTVTTAVDKAGNQVRFSVADDGKGIPDSDKKKIFEKFYRVGNKATKEAKGTGLGLYLTKKIVQQHKAGIEVKDNLPAGTIFTITFEA